MMSGIVTHNSKDCYTTVLVPTSTCYPALVYWQFLAFGRTLDPTTEVFIAHKSTCKVCKQAIDQLHTQCLLESAAESSYIYFMRQCYQEAKKCNKRSASGLLCLSCNSELVQVYKDPVDAKKVVDNLINDNLDMYGPIYFFCDNIMCLGVRSSLQKNDLGLPTVAVLNAWADIQKHHSIFKCPECSQDISKHFMGCHYQMVMELVSGLSGYEECNCLSGLLKNKNDAQNWVS